MIRERTIPAEPPQRDWYTVPEAAAKLGLSVNTTYALLIGRKLGCRKVGPSRGRYQITAAHIAAYLESCEVGPPASSGPVVAPARAPAPLPGHVGTITRLDGQPPRHLKIKPADAPSAQPIAGEAEGARKQRGAVPTALGRGRAR